MVYSRKELMALMDNDEIELGEAAFMEGYCELEVEA